ncbi:DUF6895 family protein [Streptomyces sp. NPDC049627]|uniref:DUF6895 family protein n=1 Tax=Streptomyces sp. NPDC049627 TaxID=3365595 RepID=UPI003788F22D
MSRSTGAGSQGAVSWAPLPPHARTDAAGHVGLGEDEAAERVLAGGLHWIEAQLEWFEPGRWEQFLPRRPFRPGPLLELLGLIRVLDRAGVLSKAAPLATDALDLAERVAADPSFDDGLRRADAYFPYHLNLIGLLELLGRPQPARRTVCEALLAADAGGHALPYKPALNRIELRYFADRGGFGAPPSLPRPGALLGESIAALGPDVLQLSESETYALTHVVFYATDFGHHSLTLGGHGTAARLREAVRVLLGVHLARGSLDLLAELLLCTAALDEGHGTTPLTHAGWNVLAGAARPDGALPSPVHRPEALAGLSGDKAAAYLFGTCYHTTTAAVLAAAVRRHRGQGRTGQSPVVGGVPPLPCADPVEIRAWAREVSASARTAPASVRAAWSDQLDPLLALCVQARDPSLLGALLRVADHLDRSDRPTPRRAAALLTAWTT